MRKSGGGLQTHGKQGHYHDNMDATEQILPRNKTRQQMSPHDFLEDLKTTIQPWIDAGDQVIVGIDANKDVRQGATHSMF